jgi:hypothetical protein
MDSILSSILDGGMAANAGGFTSSAQPAPRRATAAPTMLAAKSNNTNVVNPENVIPLGEDDFSDF